jgi:hypothetical protein
VVSTSLLLVTAMLLPGCGKKEDASVKGKASASTPVQATVPTTNPAATSSPTPSPVASVAEDPEVARKRADLDRALADDQIKRDPKGQWAVLATASSSYAGPTAPAEASYHAMRATGAPDVPSYADEGRAWTSKEPDAGIEWLELSYLKAVHATMVRVRQSYGPGAIAKLELFDEAGKASTVWQGPDTTVYEPSRMAWLTVKFDKTTYKTQKVRVTLATNLVQGWNQIDAVQLVGE